MMLLKQYIYICTFYTICYFSVSVLHIFCASSGAAFQLMVTREEVHLLCLYVLPCNNLGERVGVNFLSILHEPEIKIHVLFCQILRKKQQNQHT